MNVLRYTGGVVIATAAAVLMARASGTPVRWHAPDVSELRLSWSARPERLEQCRTLSDEELAKEAAHMRQRVECEGHFATYDLVVVVDDSTQVRKIVRGGGLRHDRPLHLLASVPLAPGSRHVRVSFARRETVDSVAISVRQDSARTEPDTGLYAGRAAREAAERIERSRAAIAPVMVLDTTLTMAPASVILITYDAVARALRIRDR